MLRHTFIMSIDIQKLANFAPYFVNAAFLKFNLKASQFNDIRLRKVRGSLVILWI